jgi:hypothetical protein
VVAASQTGVVEQSGPLDQERVSDLASAMGAATKIIKSSAVFI